jgi:acyl-CoA thioester hydrolase
VRGASARVRIRVRYGETDKMGVVYHGAYLPYFEVARVELLRAAGLPHRRLEEQGTIFVVAETGVKYLGRARYDDEIEILAWVAGLGQASVRFEYEARLAGQPPLLATGFTVLACVDGRGAIRKLPREVAAELGRPA